MIATAPTPDIICTSPREPSYLIGASSAADVIKLRLFARTLPRHTTRERPMLVSTANVRAATTLRSISNPELSTLKPLPITVEYAGDSEYVATFKPANISISGESARDAIDALKAELAWLFKTLSAEPILGPMPKRRLEVLGRYLGAKGR